MMIREGIAGASPSFDYQPTPGKRFWSVGVDLGTQCDHTAVVAIETEILPLQEWCQKTWKQKLADPVHVVMAAHRLKLRLDYPMGIEAIYTQTDDCIYFSKLLIEDLMAHGKNLKRAHEKQFRGKPPKIGRVDLTELEDQGLMPPPENYPDWTDAFKKES